MNKLTIITLTYNNFEELVKTIESCRDIPHCENLIINGGSCERTLAFLNNSSLRHISEQDKGIANAFNKGVLNTTTEFIQFINSGDILSRRSYIDEAIKHLVQDDSIGYIHSNLELKNGKVLKPKFGNIGLGMPFLHPTLIHRKALYDKVGLFDENFKIAMDYDWAVRLSKLDVKGHYLSLVSIMMDDAGTSVQNEKEAFRECYTSLCVRNAVSASSLLGFGWRYAKFAIRSFLWSFC